MVQFSMFGKEMLIGSLDMAGIVVLLVLIIMYIVTVINDIRDYDKMDPVK